MTKKKKKSVKKDRQEKRLQCLSEKEQQKIDDIAECLAETEYQIKCQCAIYILIAKLQMINTELSKQKGRTVVNQISSRKKSAESIYAKLVRKGYKTDFQTAAEKLNDLVGVRVVCPFEDEVYEVANILKAQGDVEVLKEKDYIKVPKKNGYKSLHITLEIPIYFAKGSQNTGCLTIDGASCSFGQLRWITGLCWIISCFIRSSWTAAMKWQQN